MRILSDGRSRSFFIYIKDMNARLDAGKRDDIGIFKGLAAPNIDLFRSDELITQETEDSHEQNRA